MCLEVGIFKLRFACSFLCVIPFGELIFCKNVVWLVCVPLLITLCAFSKSLESLLLGLFYVCMLKWLACLDCGLKCLCPDL